MDIGRQMDSRGAIEKFKQSFLRFWVLHTAMGELCPQGWPELHFMMGLALVRLARG